MKIKKIIVRISFLFLVLTAFSSCTKSSIDEEVSELEMEHYGSDKENSGSIGSSGGDDSDDDYN